MVDPIGLDVDLVFAAHNNHAPGCGRPARLKNSENRTLYYGYFENCHGEQFVFTFDRATQTGTVSGGDLGWENVKTFTLGLLEVALYETQRLASLITVRAEADTQCLPVIDSAFALGRLTGLTAKDEIAWLRSCLAACTIGK
jgi:hypothetical protein